MDEQTPSVIELVFASRDEGIEEEVGGKKLIWKDILREGLFPRTPGLKKKVPFEVVAKGKSSITPEKITVSMSDLITAHEDKAFDSVTIPDGHPKPGDSAFNNTGYVDGLRMVKKRGKHFLQGGLGFTEPDSAAKVKRGSVPNVSSGIFLNFTHKVKDKMYPACLNHVALTKSPFMDDLDPFERVYASDDAIGDDIEIMGTITLADEDEVTEPTTAEVVWNEQDGSNWLRSALETALRPDEPQIEDGRPYVPRPNYFVQDISQTKNVGLVEEYFKGDRSRHLVPFTVEEDSVNPAPSTRWVEVREALIAASDEPQNEDKTTNFDAMSSDSLRDRLGIALSDMLGEVGKSYAVKDVGMDNRARIVDSTNAASFIAEFAVLDGGMQILLSPTSQWEREAAAPAKAESKQQSAPASKENVVSLFDETTPEGRVAAARQRRRQSMSSVN